MKPKIGILGYGGQVGKLVMQYLEGQYTMRCGQRTANKVSSSEQTTYVQLDIYNEEELKRFCDGCQVIINCIGPSYEVAQHIVRIATKVGAAYVDVFGANLLEIKEELQSNKVVIGAGSVPGLSGMLPAWLLTQYNEEIESIKIFAGGNEKITKAACTDVLMSMLKGFGKSDTYYLKGKRMPIKKEFIFVPEVFGITAKALPYLTDEIFRAAQYSKLPQLTWYNVQINPAYEEMMEKATRTLINTNDKVKIDQVATQVKEEAQSFSQLSDKWYKIWMEATLKTGEESHIGFAFKDTYEINALMAVLCAKKLIELPPSNGLYWPFEILNAQEVIETLRNMAILSFINEPYDALGELVLEEGEIE